MPASSAAWQAAGSQDPSPVTGESPVEWHMQFMSWLPGKWRRAEASRLAW